MSTEDRDLRTHGPEDPAAALLALVDGLSLRLLARRYPAQTALDALDAHLAALFGDANAASSGRRRRK